MAYLVKGMCNQESLNFKFVQEDDWKHWVRHEDILKAILDL